VDRAAESHPELHKNVPPHGGTPVALGDDYCVEFVRDGGAGTLSAYLLDDEMEEFIRITAPSFTIVARIDGVDRPLVLGAVASSATGETVGSTSLFQAQADWLKTVGSFNGTLQAISIRGTDFSRIPFSLPAAPGKD
jgi:hypothetical protein